MAIKIVEDGPDIVLTRSQEHRLRQEYAQAFSMYAGIPPTFEEWVRRRLKDEKDGTGGWHPSK